MERFFIPSLVWGAIFGGILGILLLIPIIYPFIFFLMFIASGIATVIILKKFNFAAVITIYDGCFIGAVSGFVSLIATSIIYLPLAMIFGSFFALKGGYDLLAIFLLVFSTALLSALFNAFSAMVTAYVFEKLEANKISFSDHIDLEIEKYEE